MTKPVWWTDDKYNRRRFRCVIGIHDWKWVGPALNGSWLCPDDGRTERPIDAHVMLAQIKRTSRAALAKWEVAP